MTESTDTPVRRKIIAWLWTILAVGIAVEFGINAVQKLAGTPSALAPFVEFGWPHWLAILTALGEIVGSLALIVPLTRTAGGILLTLIMVGAAFTNIANGHPDYVWLNAVLIAGSLLLAWQSRKNLSRLGSLLRRR